MLVTLFLISTNVYSSIDAPPGRGFSYIELWMVGMFLPISFALVEYSVILGVKKYQIVTNVANPKLFINRKTNEGLKPNQDDTIFKKLDKTFFFNVPGVIYVSDIRDFSQNV